MRLISVGIFFAVAYYFLNSLLYTWLPTNYIFDPLTLNQIVNSVIVKHEETSTDYDIKAVLHEIRDSLASHYGDNLINKYVEEDRCV